MLNKAGLLDFSSYCKKNDGDGEENNLIHNFTGNMGYYMHASGPSCSKQG